MKPHLARYEYLRLDYNKFTWHEPWSALNFRKTLDLDGLLTWARDMVTW